MAEAVLINQVNISDMFCIAGENSPCEESSSEFEQQKARELQ
jgi:hypothetical protein